MRELTKSMLSYTWAMSLFGVQQMFNAFRPSKAAESFDNVTEATEEEFGDTLRATFRAGDNLQSGLVDLTFSVFSFGMFGRGGGGSRRATTSDIGQQSAEAFRQGMRAVGQTADAIGQTVQGAAAAADAATRQGVGWASTQRGAGRGADAYDRGAGYGATADAGRQAADAVGQGFRAAGRAAEAVGQTIEGAAYATADAVTGATGDRSATRDTRRDGGAYARRDAATGRGGAAGAQSSGGGGQGWGPMPSQSSGSTGR